jgi:predicted amidohydrolase YtcJ
VTREQALAGFTTGAAYAAFAEAKVGSLTPGHHADFILVDVDPLLASPSELRKAVVSETWVSGRPVYRNAAAIAAQDKTDGEKR